MKRNKISRLLAVSMSLCLLAAGLTGCSSSGEDSTEQENTAEDSSSQESAETTDSRREHIRNRRGGDRDPCGSGSQPGVRL